MIYVYCLKCHSDNMTFYRLVREGTSIPHCDDCNATYPRGKRAYIKQLQLDLKFLAVDAAYASPVVSIPAIPGVRL